MTLKEGVAETLFLKPVTEQGMIDIVQQCKSKSSLDKDHISMF